ncbi:hypothetical protein KVV02_007111 [Mortierella alpina]|uniref:Fatty acid desaturase domain-containing protein n=1 Tax=Mortierella alpina TaxID=64518 RepID=A0A9P8IHL3_MORAP|nr:hypothetical protein KVV02_007111 [Mortierella alpina]
MADTLRVDANTTVSTPPLDAGSITDFMAGLECQDLAISPYTSAKVKRLVLITAEDLRTPTIALPTIAVAAGSLAAWASVLYYGAYKRKVSSLWTFPVMTAACFASFTPAHDAAHSSIAKGAYKTPIHQFVGILSGVPLFLPFHGFRHEHLLHHKHTGTDKDPDMVVLQGSTMTRFFVWLLPEFFMLQDPKALAKRPKAVESVMFHLIVLCLMKMMCNRGVSKMALMKYWALPSRAAWWLLTCLFAYVPHRQQGEHHYTVLDNVYKTTSVTGGILSSNGLNLAVPLLNQHLHNIHHLYPQLPFSHYGAIWAKHKDALIEAGTEIRPLLARPSRTDTGRRT